MVVTTSRNQVDVDKFNRLCGGCGMLQETLYEKEVQHCYERVERASTELLNKKGYFRDGKFSASRPMEILYMDPDNPVKQSFHNKHEQISGWKRARQIIANPVLYKDGIEVSDIKQGSIGTCWLVSAFSVIALSPVTIERCLVSYNEEVGVYGFVFYKNGRWVTVVIDDVLPISRKNKLIFSRGLDEEELWVALFEKAFAKLHGAYEAIVGGIIGDAMVDLTGGVRRTFHLTGISKEDKNDLWDCITKVGVWRHLGCTIKSDDGEKALPNGLRAGHAYGIVAFYRSPCGRRLIRIRNPWGRGVEWNGKWSDKSYLWNKFPAIRDAVDYVDEEDGLFWMCWTDFLATWTRIDVVRVFPPKKRYCQLYDQSVPGAKIPNRYSFIIQEKQSVTIAVDQKDLRYAQEAGSFSQLGFTIRKADKSWSHTVRKRKDRSISWWPPSGKLEPDHYIIVVNISSDEPVPYYVRLFTTKSVTLVPGLKA